MQTHNTLELQTTDTSEKLVMMRLMQENLSHHDHHFFELAYVVSGTAKHELNGTPGTLQPGDYFFIDFGSSHSYEQVQDLDLINCLFLPEFIDETLQGCKSLDTLLHACMIRYHQLTIGESWADRIFHDQDGQIGQLLMGMVDEYKNKKIRQHGNFPLPPYRNPDSHPPDCRQRISISKYFPISIFYFS